MIIFFIIILFNIFHHLTIQVAEAPLGTSLEEWMSLTASLTTLATLIPVLFLC